MKNIKQNEKDFHKQNIERIWKKILNFFKFRKSSLVGDAKSVGEETVNDLNDATNDCENLFWEIVRSGYWNGNWFTVKKMKNLHKPLVHVCMNCQMHESKPEHRPQEWEYPWYNETWNQN